MSGIQVLNHDWDDYDKRKIREKQKVIGFSCNQQWESSYLASKIKLIFPGFDKIKIQEAILQICNEITGTVAREEFVNRVMGRLSVKNNPQ